jgi:hypothetical protein
MWRARRRRCKRFGRGSIRGVEGGDGVSGTSSPLLVMVVGPSGEVEKHIFE